MSNVLKLFQGISEMAFYSTAYDLRTELSSLLYRDKVVPKKYRVNVTYRALDTINRIMSTMHRANRIYPYTPEEVERRKALQQECIDSLDDSYGFIDATNRDRPPEQHGQGLYIGPEDSQIYAVAYPNRIDHKIKDELRQRYYNRYMDDSYIIHRDKAVLQAILDVLLEEYAKYGIIPNPKKTQIVKISKGFTYLKTRYYLTDTGRVIKKADHSCIVRERRKLKKLHRLYVLGEVTLEQITQSYMSWRSAILKRDAYRSVQSMDALFFELYGTTPWRNLKKKRGKYNGRNPRSDHRGDHRPEIPAA